MRIMSIESYAAEIERLEGPEAAQAARRKALRGFLAQIRKAAKGRFVRRCAASRKSHAAEIRRLRAEIAR